MYFKMISTCYENSYIIGKKYIDSVKLIGNQAVMFDIDDTLLKVCKNGTLKKIQPVIDLLKYCGDSGFLVYKITARPNLPGVLESTIKELKYHGIPYSGLFLRDPRDESIYYKSNIKGLLKKENINFIMSVGDNDMDIIGNFSGFCIKLPKLQAKHINYTLYVGKNNCLTMV